MRNVEARRPHGLNPPYLGMLFRERSLRVSQSGDLSFKKPHSFHPLGVPVGPFSKMAEDVGSCSNPAEGARGADLVMIVVNSGRTTSASFTKGLPGCYLSPRLT